MFLDPVKDIHAHLAVHHVDGKTPFTKPTCAANPVEVCFVVWVTILIHWQVKVDDHRHLFNINSFKRQKVLIYLMQEKKIRTTFYCIYVKHNAYLVHKHLW